MHKLGALFHNEIIKSRKKVSIYIIVIVMTVGMIGCSTFIKSTEYQDVIEDSAVASYEEYLKYAQELENRIRECEEALADEALSPNEASELREQLHNLEWEYIYYDIYGNYAKEQDVGNLSYRYGILEDLVAARQSLLDMEYSGVSSSSEDASGELVGNAYSESVLKQVKLLLDSDAFDRQLMAGLPEAEGIQQDTEEEREFFDLLEKTISYTYEVGSNKLSVKISALNEPDLASHLEAQVKAKLPSYIESVMNDMDEKTTTCTQLSFRPSELLNEGQTIKEMIKFGLIIGLVALIVACIAVVIVDRTDTRLRDYEELPRKFNVPVLGVIPRIETVPDDRHDVKHTEERK